MREEGNAAPNNGNSATQNAPYVMDMRNQTFIPDKGNIKNTQLGRNGQLTGPLFR
jgi:hypothetical protein